MSALLAYHQDSTEENYRDLLSEIYSVNAEEHLLSSVEEIILRDKNAFSVACATTGKPSAHVKKAYAADLKIVLSALSAVKTCTDFDYSKPLPVFDCGSYENLIYDLSDFYRANGYGEFIGNRAFEYLNGGFIPLKETDVVTLEMLKGYESEKKLIENNIRDFLGGLPYSHMLLYGDRGTGKSSTIHAMLNKYYDGGLRLIEVEKENLKDIKEIKQQVADLPLKFIIFIDDLALSEQDDKNSLLKSAIEGSLSASKNVMIVATSNRRHVIKESFADRDNSVHPADSIEEQLSLSDRFGLTVMFSSTDKASYLSIVQQLAKDYKLTTPDKSLEALAERWAIVNGGRSPRRAKQFIDYVYACEQSQREIDF
ncbi:MAG: ATP-binding protein [Clostridia bacterium]|nr:ATP-binding protein [Clostridia bacterium]